MIISQQQALNTALYRLDTTSYLYPGLPGLCNENRKLESVRDILTSDEWSSKSSIQDQSSIYKVRNKK